MSGEVVRIQQMIFPEDEKENHKLYYSGTEYERTEAGLCVTEGGGSSCLRILTDFS